MNDHIASGVRLGMDGFLYIAVGDKGIPKGVGRDGTTIQLHGGGVIRIRPDGTGLEVVSTGERNPLSVALWATDEIFTYGNDDDGHRWPNSLTHHIVGGHYGYPYEFINAPERALPILGGQTGGAGAQGVCYNEDALPPESPGQPVLLRLGPPGSPAGRPAKEGRDVRDRRAEADCVTKGPVADFRPFSIAVAADRDGFWLTDWAYTGWLDPNARTGRLYRLRYRGPDATTPAPRPVGMDRADRLKALDHPSMAVRLEAQRALSKMGAEAVPDLVAKRKADGHEPGRMHALWALDAIGGVEARRAIVAAIDDDSARIRLQASRSAGIRRDRDAVPPLIKRLEDRDAAVRREAAIAIGRIGDRSAAGALYAALDESEGFAAWSIRGAIRTLGAWDKEALVAALLDERRAQPALKLTDEAWAVPVAEALTEALRRSDKPAMRARIVNNLSGIFRQYPEWSGAWFGTNPAAGPLPEKTRNWSPEGMQAVANGLATALMDRDVEVRARAIDGLARVGPDASALLAAALKKEPDDRNQAAIADALGRMKDAGSLAALSALLADPNRAEPVRMSALRGWPSPATPTRSAPG